MTTMELRAELFREMNPLLDNETAMKKLLAFVKTLLSSKKEDNNEFDDASRVSPIISWHALSAAPSEWDPHEAWEQLTEAQKKDAAQLNLTPDDMDERTFAIIKKHMK